MGRPKTDSGVSEQFSPTPESALDVEEELGLWMNKRYLASACCTQPIGGRQKV